MNDIKRVVALLRHSEQDRRIAAAIVLGEIGTRDAGAIEGLGELARSGVPALERVAIEAAGRIGGSGGLKLVPEMFRLSSSADAGVREAAVQALIALGEPVIPKIRARLPEAGESEKRALDTVLASLGGSDAFMALLEGLLASDGETARRAALEVRQHVKETKLADRRRLADSTIKFLKRKDVAGREETIAAGLKILGYLEDPRSLGALSSYASDEGAPSAVRQEAIIALRFVLGADGAGADAAFVGTLLAIAAGEDRTLARTAIETLGRVRIEPKAVPRFAELAFHADGERARFAIEKLAQTGGKEAAAALVKVMSGDARDRVQSAKEALDKIAEATPALIDALLQAGEGEQRARPIADALRARVKSLTRAQISKLLAAAVERLAAHEPGWELALAIARDADPAATAEALHELAVKMRKGKKDERELAVLRLACRSEHALEEDRVRLALLELSRSRLDTQPHARARDECLRVFEALRGRGVDVAEALKKDKGVGIEQLFYLGFHFAELQDPTGGDLLEEVVKRGGRTKLARMAKNKLELEQKA